MRTIFITSFNPFISRNILETGVVSLLSIRGTRVVVLVPEYKKDYFKKNFEAENVAIEGVPSLKLSRQYILFKYLGGSLVDTTTRLFHQKRKYLSDQNRVHFYFSRMSSRFFSKFDFVKKIVRWLDLVSIDASLAVGYLDKYSPSLLFSTDVFHDLDVCFLALCKKRNIPTVGMVRSWDNITNKGLFRVKPDKLIVHNEIIKKEAVKYEDIESYNIFVSGLPQFDHYINNERSDRKAFFRKLGFNPSDRLVFVGPLGRRFANTDGQILDILKQSLLEKKLPGNVKFLVRFPPNDDVSFCGFVPDNNFFVYKPGIRFKENVYSDWEVTMNEDLSLADSLYHSDLAVVYASSLIIDAAAFDKPILCVSFDGFENKKELASANRFINFYTHAKKMVETQCCKIVRNEKELVDGINTYFKNPSLNKENRKQFFLEQSYKFDGKSGIRIAEFIISQIAD